ncbi:hypothetical protein BX666DRAFT_1205866 [Dichotomocladium elegans]|nr:hypothetical protein BX666DRAFT_1205866 [Dichotomocladium elegans]
MPSQEISIPPFQQIVLYTGNLIEAIDDTLQSSLKNPNQPPSFRFYRDQSLLEVPDFRFQSRISREDRKDVEVTAKLFYLNQNDSSKENVDLAVNYVKSLLGVEFIDNFILSYTPDAATPASINNVWNQLERHHQEDVIGKLGVAEFTSEQLERILSDNAVSIKPSVNQINVAQCGSMPPSMLGLAKQHKVELLYNGDRPDIIDSDTLTALLYRHKVLRGDGHVVPRFVVKYHVFVRCRSVVVNKGYIVVADARE